MSKKHPRLPEVWDFTDLYMGIVQQYVKCFDDHMLHDVSAYLEGTTKYFFKAKTAAGNHDPEVEKQMAKAVRECAKSLHVELDDPCVVSATIEQYLRSYLTSSDELDEALSTKITNCIRHGSVAARSFEMRLRRGAAVPYLE